MSSGAKAGIASSGAINGLGILVGKDSPEVKAHIPDYAAHMPIPLAENGTDYAYGLQRLWRTSGGTAHAHHNDRLGSAERLAIWPDGRQDATSGACPA
jgi:hypothetical protein